MSRPHNGSLTPKLGVPLPSHGREVAWVLVLSLGPWVDVLVGLAWPHCSLQGEGS